MARPAIAASRREEILSAFEACVARQGVDATTLTDVATEAGLPRSLVRYFMGNRDDLIEGLIDRMTKRSFELLPRALEAQKRDGPEALVETVLHEVFFNDTSNRVMVQLWIRSLHDQPTAERIREVYKNCVDQIAEHLYGKRVSKQQRDRCYALATMAIGHAIFSEFGVAKTSKKQMTRLGMALVTEEN